MELKNGITKVCFLRIGTIKSQKKREWNKRRAKGLKKKKNYRLFLADMASFASLRVSASSLLPTFSKNLPPLTSELNAESAILLQNIYSLLTASRFSERLFFNQNEQKKMLAINPCG